MLLSYDGHVDFLTWDLVNEELLLTGWRIVLIDVDVSPAFGRSIMDDGRKDATRQRCTGNCHQRQRDDALKTPTVQHQQTKNITAGLGNFYNRKPLSK
jgi:hypothetical protein